MERTAVMADNITTLRQCRRGLQYRYILNCISVANRDTLFISDRDRLLLLAECFMHEHKQTGRGLLLDLTEWLQGLPTCIAIAYQQGDIVAIGKAWGGCKTRLAEQRFCEQWFTLLASRIIQMAGLLNVNLRGE